MKPPFFNRSIEENFKRAIGSFPAVVLTGARQTGKTTLCKQLLVKTHRYVSLEDPDQRRLALDDPRAFLENYPPPVIFDEIQYAPELPSYLQGIIDQNRQQYGQFILTGSQNFLFMEQVAQSLAGRVAVLSLYPATVLEADGPKAAIRDSMEGVCDWILRGGYPELRSRPELDRETWVGSYIRLYLERDVRKIVNVTDLATFERFLRLVAARTGNLLNLSDLARDAGVSQPTVQRWLSVLEASYQIVLLQPYFTNLSKRLVKSPKLYFTDTALASYLMGIHDKEILQHGPSFGALFETATVMEYLKTLSFSPKSFPVYFFRTSDGIEVDLLIETPQEFLGFEVKASKTPSIHWADNLEKN